MPPEPPRDAIVIVLDVGKSVSNLNYWEDKTFFEQSRECISWIIQRKLISQSKDLLSLILMGSEISDNAVTAPGYKNISCKYDFQVASWDMLKFIKNEVEATDHNSDWIGGLVVAMEMVKECEKLDNIQNKKIVFFSDFTHPASDDLNMIARRIESLDIEITIIGPTYISLTVSDDDDDDDDDDEVDEVEMPPEKRRKLENNPRHGRSRGEKLVSELWSKLPNNIGICSFETALKQLCAYIRKPVRKTPWNCLLDIGDVKINISMFKKTDPKPAKKFITKCLRDLAEDESDSNRPTVSQESLNFTPNDLTSTVRDKVMSYKHELGQDSGFVDVQVQPEDTVEGFRYGATIIPFAEEDKKILQFKSGPKSFSVIGFSSISSVPYYLLSGEKSYFVVAKDADEYAEVALSALIQAMKEIQVLAVVRRVYSNDSGLSLGILYPVIEEIISEESDEVFYKEYLLFVELAFEEEVKAVTFPSLEPIAKNLSEKQLEAIDDLIEGMDLMKADKGFRGEPCEAFEITKLHDFKEQFFHYCQVQRGLYPDKPLPASLPSYIEDYTKTPATLETKVKFLVKEIKEQFKIEINKKKIVEEKNAENETSGVMDSSSSSIVTVGEKESSGNANGHFEMSLIEKESDSTKRGLMELFSKGFPSDSELETFLENVKEKESEEDIANLLKCFEQVITVVRKRYLKTNPDEFNWWMEQFKAYTHSKTGLELELWNIIVRENLGLVTVKENELSRVTEEEGEGFIYEDVTESLRCPSPKQKKPDFEPDRDNLDDLRAEQMGIESLF